MTASIHPSSVIHDGAKVSPSANVGPFCEIGPKVRLGDRVKLHGRVTIVGETTLGEDVEVYPGAVLGQPAQSLGASADPGTGLKVGDRTILREHVTLHAGTLADSRITRIGADCFLMAYCHVGHDCKIGDRNVYANTVNLAGHIETGDHVWIGGSVAIHQFCEIGDHAFVAGGAIVVGDVIPFGLVSGNRASLQGLNVKGLSRRGVSRSDQHALRRAYKALFEGEGAFRDRILALEESGNLGDHPRQILEFIKKERLRPLCMPDRS
ncbi:MAG: acyl-ACP--UDP-N-acetylglucosamine O-acyltransferase [Pseudomonadota bacterium]